MRPALLYLVLLSSCSYIRGDANYRIYELSWTCLSPEGCERADRVPLFDRMEIVDGSKRITLLSSRDEGFIEFAELIDSGDLPEECSWLYSLTLFTHELDPGRFCRVSNGLEIELAIPNRDPTTSSEWLVEGKHIGP